MLQPGEKCKSIGSCEIIWNNLLEKNADRKSLVINLGGGVITDVGGFASSVFKRGIQFVNIPTSLLGMVDASIGGKTGINLNGLKNQVGTFVHPKFNFIHYNFLKTLPENELFSGFGEIIKYALLTGGLLWDSLDTKILSPLNGIENVIKPCIDYKIGVVEKDMYESGLRKVLNLGHTVGHGLESVILYSEEQAISHGEAVALGCVVEAALSMKYAGLSEGNYNKIKKIVSSWFDLSRLRSVNIKSLAEKIKDDKKNMAGEINIILLNSPGDVIHDFFISPGDLNHFLQEELNSLI